jgi:apolipoprotein N-acyltransferase
MEYMHTIWAPAWPWFPLGNGLAENTDWIQWYAFTGVQGGSLWILCINWLLYQTIRYGMKQEWKQASWFSAAIVLLTLGPLSFSNYLQNQNLQEASYPVAIVQPNINPRTEKFNGLTEQEQVGRTLQLISSTDFTGRRIVIFPETFLTNPINEDSVFFSVSLQNITSHFIEFQPISLIMGAFTKLDSSRAIYDQDALVGKKNPYVLYNSAILLNEKDTLIYHKMKLLPLVEKQIFMPLLMPFRDYIEKSGAYFGSYGIYNEYDKFLLSDSIIAAPVICFESVFGAYTAERVLKNDADFIVLITNDGWWSSDGGYLQHLAYARLRCIETGKWMVRCANTGVSAIIDNHGTIMQKTKYGEATVLMGKVGMNKESPTFYTRNGDLIGKYALISLIVFFVFGLYLRFGKYHFFR